MDENNELENQEDINLETTEENTEPVIGDEIEGAENIETNINEDNNNLIFKCEFSEAPIEQFKYAEIMYGKVISIHRHFMPLELFKRLFVPNREADFIDILPAEIASGIEVQIGDYVFHDGNGTLRIERPVYDDTVEGTALRKLDELKMRRDEEEVQIIEVNGYPFDYDSKARERINAAIISLDVLDTMTGTTNDIGWTLADNTSLMVTANDLRLVVAKIAERSNVLHIKYRDLKAIVNGIKDDEILDDEEKIERINNVSWDEPEPEESGANTEPGNGDSNSEEDSE